MESGFFKHDLDLKYSSPKITPINQRYLNNSVNKAPRQLYAIKKQLELMEISECHGYHNHYFILSKSRNESGKYLFSISKKGIDSLEFVKNINRYKTKLTDLARAIDYIGTTRFAQSFLSKTENISIFDAY